MRARVSLISLGLFVALAACGSEGEPAACKSYYEAVEACAAKNEGSKAEILRAAAKRAKEMVAERGVIMGVATCESLMQVLEDDPACKL